MDQEEATVSWKKFSVHLAGKTNDAHHAIVAKFKAMGQTEVHSDEESDYLLVFCPIASRVGTDIGEALDNIPGDKPVILVVMHHTSNRNHVVVESRRLVKNLNVYLTVDFVFHKGKLLECDPNDSALRDVRKFFTPQNAISNRFLNNPLLNSFWAAFAGFCTVVGLLISFVLGKRKKSGKTKE